MQFLKLKNNFLIIFLCLTIIPIISFFLIDIGKLDYANYFYLDILSAPFLLTFIAVDTIYYKYGLYTDIGLSITTIELIVTIIFYTAIILYMTTIIYRLTDQKDDTFRIK
ncbi:MAG: hypothetical protein AAB446_01210 [Patescibacteria group bacterium]